MRFWTKSLSSLLCAVLVLTGLAASAANYHLSYGGDFTLLDHNGQPFSLSSARGKVVVLYFGFTSCGETCPVTLAKLSAALRQLGEHARNVQPLFISVDPKRDTPQGLRQYVVNFHPSILGLTGTREQIEAVARQYRSPVHVRKANATGDYVVDHGSRLFLIDRQGSLANILLFEASPDRIAVQIRDLLDN